MTKSPFAALSAFRLARRRRSGRAHLNTTTMPLVDSLSPRQRSGERVRERGFLLAAPIRWKVPLSPFVPRREREQEASTMVVLSRCARGRNLALPPYRVTSARFLKTLTLSLSDGETGWPPGQVRGISAADQLDVLPSCARSIQRLREPGAMTRKKGGWRFPRHPPQPSSQLPPWTLSKIAIPLPNFRRGEAKRSPFLTRYSTSLTR